MIEKKTKKVNNKIGSKKPNVSWALVTNVPTKYKGVCKIKIPGKFGSAKEVNCGQTAKTICQVYVKKKLQKGIAHSLEPALCCVNHSSELAVSKLIETMPIKYWSLSEMLELMMNFDPLMLAGLPQFPIHIFTNLKIKQNIANLDSKKIEIIMKRFEIIKKTSQYQKLPKPAKVLLENIKQVYTGVENGKY